MEGLRTSNLVFGWSTIIRIIWTMTSEVKVMTSRHTGDIEHQFQGHKVKVTRWRQLTKQTLFSSLVSLLQCQSIVVEITVDL